MHRRWVTLRRKRVNLLCPSVLDLDLLKYVGIALQPIQSLGYNELTGKRALIFEQAKD